ncbi:GntR family transcriptional regulator [Geomicrobium sp. JSM 1781026]|uniref:GntR family transcriptional regulator n=1 Tax=Geomicrobium sp. JSM 1781026 TaxID=3344580 RepID=UPI0035BF9C8F
MMEELNKHSLAKQIADQISMKIMSGDLKPGDKLVEKDYADEYGISRAPIRDALYLLTAEGLVEKEARKGAVVRTYSFEEIKDILEVRNFLEHLAMERIEERGIDQDYVTRMQDLGTTMREETDVYHYTYYNHQFHLLVVQMSNSKMILDLYHRIGSSLLRVQAIAFSEPGKLAKSKREHDLLTTYLKDNHIQKAKTLLNTHTDDVLKLYEQFHNK